MINEAKDNEKADEIVRKRIEAKNELQSYCYSVKNSLKAAEFRAKAGEDNAKNCENLADDLLKWVDEHSDAYAEEFEAKKKELEQTFSPIATQAYSQAGANPQNDGQFENRNNQSQHQAEQGFNATVDGVD
jgi:L1 cell adhesion molecule like protein